MLVINYLNDCKKKLGIESSYALSKELGIKENVLSNYYLQKRTPDTFMCFKIAKILEVDVSLMIASIKSCSEKTEERREFFKSFRNIEIKF